MKFSHPVEVITPFPEKTVPSVKYVTENANLGEITFNSGAVVSTVLLTVIIFHR